MSRIISFVFFALFQFTQGQQWNTQRTNPWDTQRSTSWNTQGGGTPNENNQPTGQRPTPQLNSNGQNIPAQLPSISFNSQSNNPSPLFATNTGQSGLGEGGQMLVLSNNAANLLIANRNRIPRLRIRRTGVPRTLLRAFAIQPNIWSPLPLTAQLQPTEDIDVAPSQNNDLLRRSTFPQVQLPQTQLNFPPIRFPQRFQFSPRFQFPPPVPALRFPIFPRFRPAFIPQGPFSSPFSLGGNNRFQPAPSFPPLRVGGLPWQRNSQTSPFTEVIPRTPLLGTQGQNSGQSGGSQQWLPPTSSSLPSPAPGSVAGGAPQGTQGSTGNTGSNSVQGLQPLLPPPSGQPGNTGSLPTGRIPLPSWIPQPSDVGQTGSTGSLPTGRLPLPSWIPQPSGLTGNSGANPQFGLPPPNAFLPPFQGQTAPGSSAVNPQWGQPPSGALPPPFQATLPTGQQGLNGQVQTQAPGAATPSIEEILQSLRADGSGQAGGGQTGSQTGSPSSDLSGGNTPGSQLLPWFPQTDSQQTSQQTSQTQQTQTQQTQQSQTTGTGLDGLNGLQFPANPPTVGGGSNTGLAGSIPDWIQPLPQNSGSTGTGPDLSSIPAPPQGTADNSGIDWAAVFGNTAETGGTGNTGTQGAPGVSTDQQTGTRPAGQSTDSSGVGSSTGGTTPSGGTSANDFLSLFNGGNNLNVPVSPNAPQGGNNGVQGNNLPILPGMGQMPGMIPPQWPPNPLFVPPGPGQALPNPFIRRELPGQTAGGSQGRLSIDQGTSPNALQSSVGQESNQTPGVFTPPQDQLGALQSLGSVNNPFPAATGGSLPGSTGSGARQHTNPSLNELFPRAGSQPSAGTGTPQLPSLDSFPSFQGGGNNIPDPVSTEMPPIPVPIKTPTPTAKTSRKSGRITAVIDMTNANNDNLQFMIKLLQNVLKAKDKIETTTEPPVTGRMPIIPWVDNSA